MKIFTSAAFKGTTTSFTMDQENNLKLKYIENNCFIHTIVSYENSSVLTRSNFSLLPQQGTQTHFNQYESQFTV